MIKNKQLSSRQIVRDKVFVAFGKHEMSTAAQVFRHVNLLAKFQHPS